MYKTILVPVDGSEESDKALSTACELAIKYQANLHLLHASNYWQFMAGIGDGIAMVSQEDFEEPQKELLQAAVLTAREKGCASIESHFVNGDAGHGSVEKANEIGADLIVVGSRGHSDMSGLLLGSVSHKICNSADCSCLVVR